MKVTVLGCGTSSGVPQLGCRCEICLSSDVRNKRRRCSIYIEWQGLRILIDSSPDLRMQCIDAGIGEIDALIYTHAHADHLHGLDDLRAINNLMMRPIETYAHSTVFERIRSRFPYAFEGGRNEFGYWRPELTPHEIDGPFMIEGREVQAFPQQHGKRISWGFRFGPFAYSTDASMLDENAFAVLDGIEVWIVDALRDKPHPSHAHVDRTLSWIRRVCPRRSYLTHMNHEVDYQEWLMHLPHGVEPAYDGQIIELPE